jgi:tripartite-type tricarboxylate transporter receptor subunit TctC
MHGGGHTAAVAPANRDTAREGNMIKRRDLIGLAATSFATPALLLSGARAQSWPSRYVRLIVPFPPGGGTDAVARIVTSRLSEVWGQQVVIENKGGAGSNIGAEAAARAEPDGYTMLIGALPLAVNRYLFPAIGYDSITDFAPITMICLYPNLMVVPNSSPAKSVQEFIDFAKANRGKITFGSSGIGTSTHLCSELFKRRAGIEMTHVPYRGAGPAMNDLIPGRLSMMFNTAGALIPNVRAGQLRGLAVSTLERFPTAPEFPTVAESGLPGFDVSSWYTLFVPVKTPPEIVHKMNADTVAILAEPAIRARLEQLGVSVVGSTAAEAGAKLKAETELWGPIIKAAGIRGEE